MLRRSWRCQGSSRALVVYGSIKVAGPKRCMCTITGGSMRRVKRTEVLNQRGRKKRHKTRVTYMEPDEYMDKQIFIFKDA